MVSAARSRRRTRSPPGLRRRRGRSRTVDLFGFGLAVTIAIAIDATIVRLVLVPAVMAVAGRTAWYLPRWLDRLLPKIGLEPHPIDPLEAELDTLEPAALGRSGGPGAQRWWSRP